MGSNDLLLAQLVPALSGKERGRGRGGAVWGDYWLVLLLGNGWRYRKKRKEGIGEEGNCYPFPLPLLTIPWCPLLAALLYSPLLD